MRRMKRPRPTRLPDREERAQPVITICVAWPCDFALAYEQFLRCYSAANGEGLRATQPIRRRMPEPIRRMPEPVRRTAEPIRPMAEPLRRPNNRRGLPR